MSFPVRRILCPTDFSPSAAHALHFAAALGRWFGAEVQVLHVHALRVPHAYLSEPAARAGPVSAHDERDEQAAALRRFVEAEAPGMSRLSWHLDESTDIAGSIVSRATTIAADLIVLGTHGASTLHRQFVGSITERVMRTAPCAVLSVPPRASRVPGSSPHIDRVLCAIDFSPASLRALECAVMLASQVGAAVTVAHIIEVPPDMPDLPQVDLSGYRRARFDHAGACLEATLAAHRRADVRIDEMLLAGRPAPELLRLAHEQQASTIVMGVHGRTALDLLFFGSVTHQVLRQAACPILTVRR